MGFLGHVALETEKTWLQYECERWGLKFNLESKCVFPIFVDNVLNIFKLIRSKKKWFYNEFKYFIKLNKLPCIMSCI